MKTESENTTTLTWLRDTLREHGWLTVQTAWEAGLEAGYYAGGDAPMVRDHLNALCGRNQARRHDGFWRAITDDERQRAKHWSDYWTPR
jgi:hypothetical protein